MNIDETRLRQILREEFATKDDLARFATKEDLKSFATKDDITVALSDYPTKTDLDERLKIFATKDDLDRFTSKDDLEIKFTEAFGQMTQYFDKRLGKFEKKVDDRIKGLYNLLDGFVGRMDSDDAERAGTDHQLNRHDRWIGELAKNTGTTLSAP